MKGVSETITDTLLIVASVVLILALTAAILPQFLDFLKTASFDTSQLVSKEFAELITVSAAATDEIEITYNPANVMYNIEIKDRIVQVDHLNQQQIQDSSKAKIAVDAESSFARVNVFTIRKASGSISIPSAGNIGRISVQAS